MLEAIHPFPAIDHNSSSCTLSGIHNETDVNVFLSPFSFFLFFYCIDKNWRAKYMIRPFSKIVKMPSIGINQKFTTLIKNQTTTCGKLVFHEGYSFRFWRPFFVYFSKTRQKCDASTQLSKEREREKKKKVNDHRIKPIHRHFEQKKKKEKEKVQGHTHNIIRFPLFYIRLSILDYKDRFNGLNISFLLFPAVVVCSTDSKSH